MRKEDVDSLGITFTECLGKKAAYPRSGKLMRLKYFFKYYLFVIKKYSRAFWDTIIALKNPWIVPLVAFKIKKEVAVKIKSKPVEMSTKIDSYNYKILCYLSLLRNKGNLVFDGSKIKFLPCGVELLPEQISEDEVVLIYLACVHNLLLEKYKGHYLVRLKEGAKFKVRKSSHVGCLVETFVQNQYRRFYQDLNGKVVLDIGASIGDTSVCFSNDGAKIVYAYEPDSASFNLAIENLKLNHISNVKLFNLGVGDSKGKKIIPFNEVIKQVGDVDFLKMDCEGCEFPALLSLSHESLSNIREMVIEYHKNPNSIVEKLKKAGFFTKVEKTWTYDQGYPVGFLYAKKGN